MGYNSYDLSKKNAVKWGLDHEEECRQNFVAYMTIKHDKFVCRSSGFTVNSMHPFLGASPDGISSCACCGIGTLKIKCPFKHRNSTVQDAAKYEKDFCLDPTMRLKTNHRYYTQVQFQMYIADVTCCDFVVFTKCTPPSMVIVRITRDDAFCDNLISKCETFVKEHLIREFITRDLEKEPTHTVPIDDNNNDSETWCLCAEPGYGRMIKCDNDNCPYVWFHYRCVNMKRKPRGKWFCDRCIA